MQTHTCVTNTKLQLHLLKYLITGAQILFHKLQIMKLICSHFCYNFCSKCGAKHICTPVSNNFHGHCSSTNTSQQVQVLESAATSHKCCSFAHRYTNDFCTKHLAMCGAEMICALVERGGGRRAQHRTLLIQNPLSQVITCFAPNLPT